MVGKTWQDLVRLGPTPSAHQDAGPDPGIVSPWRRRLNAHLGLLALTCSGGALPTLGWGDREGLLDEERGKDAGGLPCEGVPQWEPCPRLR
jgi:hypothetical protein